MDLERATLILKMMSNPIRLNILDVLAQREKEEMETCVGKIEEILEISQSSISQHLAHLRNSGILTCSKKGKKVCYQIEDKRVLKILKSL